jgi:small ligand-binding sensory domain FIST
MKLFPYAHATHPDWRMAVELALVQLRALLSNPDYCRAPQLGVLYITDHFAGQAPAILDTIAKELPTVQSWTGTVGVGIASNNVEYFDEPALSLMLCELEENSFRVFNGLNPLSSAIKDKFNATCALIHADGNTPDLGELIGELAQNTQSNYLFGGLTSSRADLVQFSKSTASPNKVLEGLIHPHASPNTQEGQGVFTGGLSGVAFDQSVKMISRVTQGCFPISKPRKITQSDGHVILSLDGRAALDVLLEDLNLTMDSDRTQLLKKVRETLVGLTSLSIDALKKTGGLADDVCVRHIIGLDTHRKGIAVAELLGEDTQVTFCERNRDAAKSDLIRIATEIRESLEPLEMSAEQAARASQISLEDAPTPSRKIRGAVYISCAGRGGPHFGAPSAELQLIKKALGDIPLTGFFAGGEIAHQHLYGYTGVLTVFTD